MRPKSGIECSWGLISLTQEEALSFIKDACASQIVLPISRTPNMPTVFCLSLFISQAVTHTGPALGGQVAGIKSQCQPTTLLIRSAHFLFLTTDLVNCLVGLCFTFIHMHKKDTSFCHIRAMSRLSDAIPSPIMPHSSIPLPTTPMCMHFPKHQWHLQSLFTLLSELLLTLNSCLYHIYLIVMVMVSLGSTVPGLPFSNPHCDPKRLSLDYVIQPNFD